MRRSCCATIAIVFLSACTSESREGADRTTYAGQPPIHVSTSVLVSRSMPNRAHNEMRICASPANADDITAVSMAQMATPTGEGIVAYRSLDGARTWTNLSLPKALWADPDCAYGVDGSLYVVGMFDLRGDPLASTERVLRLAVEQLRSDGKWSVRIQSFRDRPFLLVDHASPKFRGRVYLTENAGKHSPRAYRIDSNGVPIILGSRASLPFVPRRFSYAFPGQGVVLLNGTLLVPRQVYIQSTPAQLLRTGAATQPGSGVDAVTLANGGSRFERETMIETTDDPACGEVATSSAVDQSPGPFRGRAYVAYEIGRYGQCEAHIAHSDDGGRTWSRPVILTDYSLAPKVADGHPWPYVAVNSRGLVGVFWTEPLRDNGDGSDFWPVFAASSDGGETFSPPVKLSRVPFSHEGGNALTFFADTSGGGSGGTNPYTATGSSFLTVTLEALGYSVGDTGGLVADARGAFHPIWMDSRTGITQLRTSRIAVGGQAERYGDSRLSVLRNVSNSATLELTDLHFTRSSRTVTASAYIKNLSNAVLRPPLIVRILETPVSFNGVASITDTDNGVKGPGAIWVFSSVTPSRLLPGESTGKRRVIFQLVPVSPALSRQDYVDNLSHDQPWAPQVDVEILSR